MSSALFEVKKTGLFTTVQDLGRTGYQQYGVVVAGAMDPFALQVANLLVGNKRNEACLEVAKIGPTLKVLKDTVICICGANLSATIDGKKLPLWKSVRIKANQMLEFGRPVAGSYAYIAIAGGIDVPMVMGSKSTYTKANLGGYHGRPLEKGDIVKTIDQPIDIDPLTGRGLVNKHIPSYDKERAVRVILGPDDDAFTEESKRVFLSTKFKISPQSDRMGYRLKGPKLAHEQHADIISDAIVPGTIQVPASGNPIILLADRQTSGGYTRIATVISVDLPYVAQLSPNDSISFKQVTIEEAQAFFVQQEKVLKQLGIKSLSD